MSESDNKYFSRHRVRTRMLKHAADLWGFAESEMDEFDPLVTMLIEACAVEFERLAGDIGSTRHRMMGRLAQLLYPGAITVRPAHGLIHCRSAEPFAVIPIDSQFVYTPTGVDRDHKRKERPLHFSPVRTAKIIDGDIRYIATSRELSEMTGFRKTLVASAPRAKTASRHSVWLGIQLHEDIDTIDGLSFFFNWINQPDSSPWYDYLPYTQWVMDNQVITHHTGWQSAATDTTRTLPDLFDPLYTAEQQAIDLFARHFITLVNPPVVKNSLYPFSFENMFDKKDLQKIREPLLWIEVHFPTQVPEEALDTLFCSINVLPVLNRRLNKLVYRLSQTLNIVPMETEEIFLSMKEIIDTEGREVKLIPFANPPELTDGSYTLRLAANRFDERDAYETLVELTHLIREESALFSSMGEDFLSRNILELDQLLARLRDKVRTLTKQYSPYPYLLVRTKGEGANIHIQFWSSNGQQANKIPAGATLTTYGNSDLVGNSIYFVTPTFGGRDKFNDAEKIDEYKTSLLSHHRIVTLEDLKTFTRAMLGPLAASVEYRKDYIKGTGPNEGFMRCMQVIVTPASGGPDAGEWDQRLRELRRQLKERSANLIPYVVKLAAS